MNRPDSTKTPSDRMAAKMSAWCRGRTFRPDDDTAVTAVVLQAFRGYMGPHDPPLIRWAIEYATREVLEATRPYEKTGPR